MRIFERPEKEFSSLQRHCARRDKEIACEKTFSKMLNTKEWQFLPSCGRFAILFTHKMKKFEKAPYAAVREAKIFVIQILS